MQKISYDGYRFPPEIIQQAIWLCLRFAALAVVRSDIGVLYADPPVRLRGPPRVGKGHLLEEGGTRSTSQK
jgi:hypothetical protein